MLRNKRIGVVFTLTALLAPLGASPAAAQSPADHARASGDMQPAGMTWPGIPGPFKIMNPLTGLCFDSNTGAAYYGRCNSTDVGQRWGWWNGGFLISLQTGKCLVPYSGWPYPYMSLVPCDNRDSRHFWTHQNMAILNKATGRCVIAGVEGEALKAEPCVTTPTMAWSVTYW